MVMADMTTNPPPGRDRVAVFVDGDNISAERAPLILKQIGGMVDVMRVYGERSKLTPWLQHEAFEPRLTSFEGSGRKNVTDLALSVDAVHVCLTQHFTKLVIASSDGDFAILARKLREMGVGVHGIGETKAPPILRRSCTQFHVLAPNAPEEPARQVAAPSDDAILKAVLSLTGPDWKGINTLATELKDKHHITKKTEGVGQWLRWFKRHPTYFEIDEDGTKSRVRQVDAAKR